MRLQVGGAKPGYDSLLQAAQEPREDYGPLDFLSGAELPKTSELGTSLDLDRRQRIAERAAETELRRAERDFARMGKMEDWDEYKEKRGRVGLWGTLSYAGERTLTPAFDLLSIGNYSTAGFVDEMLKTGSVWEGFKQAGREFANALPWVEVTEARRPSFVDVFKEQGFSRWGAWTGGLVLDMVLDPVNLIPGAMLAKGAKAGGAGLLRHSGPIKRGLDFLFTPHREIARLGEAGEAVLEHYGHAVTKREADQVRLVGKVDQLFAALQPHERILFGTFMDSPVKFDKQLNEFVQAGAVKAADLPALRQSFQDINDYTDSLFFELRAKGLIDNSMYRQFYLHGMEALDPRMRRAQSKAVAQRSPQMVSQSVLNTLAGPGVTKQKKHDTIAERLELTLSGKLRVNGEVLSTEMDIGNNLRKLTADHVGWLVSHQFLNNVINDGRIAAKVVGGPAQFAKPATWNRMKEAIRSSQPGYDVLEVTQKKRSKSGGVVDSVVGAFVLPKPIVDFVTKADTLLKNEGDIARLFDAADKWMQVWRGYALLSPGYHARNTISGLITNWLSGVGASKPWGSAGIQVPTGKFLLRHLQALHVQSQIEGLGKMPRPLEIAAARLTGLIGRPLVAPRIVRGGKLVSVEEIYSKAQEYGVVQNLSKLFDLPDEAVRSVWEGIDPAITARLSRSGTFDPTLKAAMSLQPGKRPILESANRHFGTEGVAIKANRAVGATIENNLRLALFIDRLDKGADWLEAAQATKTWHIDYRNITEVEKKAFRFMLPFYTWSRFMVPRMFMAMLENPGRVAKIPKAEAAMHRLSEDYKDLPTPDYYDEVRMVQLPLVRNSKPLGVIIDSPILELNRLNKDDVLSSMNPFIKRVFESIPARGMNFFTGAQEEAFPGQESEAIPGISRSTEATLSAFFPPAGKIIRMRKAAKLGQAGEQLFSEFTGLRVKLLDVRRVLRAQTFERRQLARDFRRRLEQDAKVEE